MTITLDYTDLHFDDDREVLAAGELDIEFELLLAQVVFRVDAADFTFDGLHDAVGQVSTPRRESGGGEVLGARRRAGRLIRGARREGRSSWLE